MIERRKLWHVGSVLILLISLIVIIQMLYMPSPKSSAGSYTLGTPIPTKASYYLEHVNDKQTVTVKADQFKEGKQVVDVVLNGNTYRVPINVVSPNIQEVTNTVSFRRVMPVGGSLDALFGLHEDYRDDASYSVSSNALTPGNHSVTLTLFGQSVTQDVEVISATQTPGSLVSKYDFSSDDLAGLIKTYLSDQEIDADSVAFVYQTGNTKIAYNETKTMLAAETAYLPVSLLAFDAIRKGAVQEASTKALVESMILASSSDAASQLITNLGGKESVYSSIGAYGKSSGVTQTVSATSQQTTADYLAQTIAYLNNHAEDYKELISYLKNSDTKTFIARYLGETPVAHKTGYVGQVINDVAIVYEKTPYTLTLLSRDIAATQYVEIAYLINEWHKYHQ